MFGQQKKRETNVSSKTDILKEGWWKCGCCVSVCVRVRQRQGQEIGSCGLRHMSKLVLGRALWCWKCQFTCFFSVFISLSSVRSEWLSRTTSGVDVWVGGKGVCVCVRACVHVCVTHIYLLLCFICLHFPPSFSPLSVFLPLLFSSEFKCFPIVTSLDCDVMYSQGLTQAF